MPRHNPALVSSDDGSRHGRRVERDQRARSRRRARRLQLTGPEDARPAGTSGRRTLGESDVARQVADWRFELALS